jgi:class 3 adenylate cyclase
MWRWRFLSVSWAQTIGDGALVVFRLSRPQRQADGLGLVKEQAGMPVSRLRKKFHTHVTFGHVRINKW